MALAFMPFLQRNYLKRAAAKGGKAEPEDRLVGMMIASVFVPICEYPPSPMRSALPNPDFLQLCSSSAGQAPPLSCLEVVTGSAL